MDLTHRQTTADFVAEELAPEQLPESMQPVAPLPNWPLKQGFAGMPVKAGSLQRFVGQWRALVEVVILEGRGALAVRGRPTQQALHPRRW